MTSLPIMKFDWDAHWAKLRAENADLWLSALGWIQDGWGLTGDPTPEQFAAALLMEANDQDGHVRRGESAATYPVRLRALARDIIVFRHGPLVPAPAVAALGACGAVLKALELLSAPDVRREISNGPNHIGDEHRYDCALKALLGLLQRLVLLGRG